MLEVEILGLLKLLKKHGAKTVRYSQMAKRFCGNPVRLRYFYKILEEVAKKNGLIIKKGDNSGQNVIVLDNVDNFPDIYEFKYIPKFICGKKYIKFTMTDDVIKKIETMEILTVEDFAKYVGLHYTRAIEYVRELLKDYFVKVCNIYLNKRFVEYLREVAIDSKAIRCSRQISCAIKKISKESKRTNPDTTLIKRLCGQVE